MPQSAPTHPSLALRLADACWRSGTFALRSGGTSDRYFDKFAINADPSLLRDVASALAAILPADTDAVAGLELGSVPLAAAVALATGLPACYARKVRKPYGTQRLAEGAHIKGKRVTVLEDVVSTGGQVVNSCVDLIHEGANVIGVRVVVDRGGVGTLRAAGLDTQALFSAGDVPFTPR